VQNREIPDSQISASTERDNQHAVSQGRLNVQETARKAGSWVAKTTDVNQWLQIDLNGYYHTYVSPTVKRVATQGRNYNPAWPHGSHSQWVTKYTLQYSTDDDGSNFQDYMKEGEITAKVKEYFV